MQISKQNELIYLNALNRISFLGPKRINLLVERFGSAEMAWNASVSEYEQLDDRQSLGDRLDRERVKIDPQAEWKRLTDHQINCISTADLAYPPLLKEIPYCPPLIYYRGSIEICSKPAVALVGSRRCTFYGREVADQLARELAAAGIVVVSGMALGVDTAAHQGALERNGWTAAVLGCGLDYCYPPKNKDLMESIITSGVVISEFPFGTAPLPRNFPQRNRIISGLSLGTVVVEATAGSGALITANFALEHNREVFAVPGNIGSPYSRGCNRLIREGARLIESAADILDELGLNTAGDRQLTLDETRAVLSADESALLEIIPYQPMHMDKIINLSGIGAAAASIALLALELKQQVRQLPGKYFCRI